MFDKEKITTIIFDWSGVCCKEGEPFASLDLQEKLSMNPEQIADEVREIYYGYYKGNYNRDTFWRAILDHFGLPEDKRLNPETLSHAYLSSYAPYPEVLEFIEKLKKKYQIGLLSNLTPEMRDHIQTRHVMKQYFDVEVYSCDPDVADIKPNAHVYEIILKKMKTQASATLFVDDSLKNGVAAEALGFQTIHFKNVAEFLYDIAILL